MCKNRTFLNVVDKRRKISWFHSIFWYTYSYKTSYSKNNGGVAQLVRAVGSYPILGVFRNSLRLL